MSSGKWRMLALVSCCASIVWVVGAQRSKDTSSAESTGLIKDVEQLTERMKHLEEALSKTVPIGSIVAFEGTEAPPGSRFCNGEDIAEPKPGDPYYPLFQMIDKRYNNAGEDKAAFLRLPRLAGRTFVGAGQGVGLTLRELGKQGGKESVQLGIANLPAHQHAVYQHAGYQTGVAPSDPGSQGTGGGDTASGIQPGTSGPTGGNQPFDIMPPFLVTNFIIKTGV